MDGEAWWAVVRGVAKSQTRLSDFPFTFHFQALEKEMATHSSVLAWRIPEMEEPDGLPSMGSHSQTRLKQRSSSSSDSSLWFQFVFLWHLMMLTIFSCIFSLASCIFSKIKCSSPFVHFLIGLCNLFFCSALRVPFLATWFVKFLFFFSVCRLLFSSSSQSFSEEKFLIFTGLIYHFSHFIYGSCFWCLV